MRMTKYIVFTKFSHIASLLNTSVSEYAFKGFFSKKSLLQDVIDNVNTASVSIIKIFFIIISILEGYLYTCVENPNLWISLQICAVCLRVNLLKRRKCQQVIAAYIESKITNPKFAEEISMEAISNLYVL